MDGGYYKQNNQQQNNITKQRQINQVSFNKVVYYVIEMYWCRIFQNYEYYSYLEQKTSVLRKIYIAETVVIFCTSKMHVLCLFAHCTVINHRRGLES